MLVLAFAAAEIWAGIGIRNLGEQARLVGIGVTALDALLVIVWLAGGAAGGGIVGLALDAYIIWQLVQNRAYFH